MTRATWDETWMRVAHAVAMRSECHKAKVGAVIVSPEQRVIATGYNGKPAILDTTVDLRVGDCRDWCPRPNSTNPSPCYDDCLSIHAEMNALMHSSRRDREGGSLYVTGSVCWTCAKPVANSGIKRVVMPFTEAYRDPEKTARLLTACGLEVVRWGH